MVRSRSARRTTPFAVVLAAAGLLAACTSPATSPVASVAPSDVMEEPSAAPSDEMMGESPSPSDAMTEPSAAPSDAMMGESPSP